MRLCKAKVAEYTNSHMDVTDRQQVTVHDVYVVWSCKTLQNNKALLSTTVPDEELLEPEYYVELMGGCGCNDCTV